MTEFQITLTDTGSDEIRDQVVDKLKAFNASKVGDVVRKPFTLSIQDDQGNLQAGLTGLVIDKMCYIQELWVDEKLRGQGLGRALIQRAEVYARSQHCEYLELDTLEYQAPGFYKKLGFEILATIEKGFKGYKQDYMRKYV